MSTFARSSEICDFWCACKKIVKIARLTVLRVHLRFFSVLSLVSDVSRKKVADFAKIAKNRTADDFLRSHITMEVNL